MSIANLMERGIKMRNTNRTVADEPVLNRILETMKEKGVNQQDVAQYLGLGNGAFTKWKYDNGKSYMKHLNRIAEYLGVSRTYLLKGINEVVKDEKLSEKEKRLVEVFRELKISEQDMFLRQIIGYRMTSEQ
jgi:transcriptional regulator with XRE-family HTH domain